MTIIGALLFVLLWVAVLVIVNQFAPPPFKTWILLAVIVIGVLVIVMRVWPGAAGVRIG